ncbi:MAG TPA: EthD family reductase [Bryobacteraceae bacterium]|nr:EthD family reductase [Bryobacteraceae bacterium]
MIKVSVMYPKEDGATFDMAYYSNSHMPMVEQKLGAALRGLSIDEGIEVPGTPLVYLAMGHLLFDSLAAFQAAMSTHGAAMMADIPNYTNSRPAIQVSEVKK